MATKFLFHDSGIYLPDGIEPLGSGRYGEVWAAYSQIGDMRRAVKINSTDHREVLQQEFEILKKLEKVDDDGLILRAYELGETDDRRPCMLMELIEAKPLRILAQELRRRVVLPGNQQMDWSLEDEILRVRVATQITNALYTAFKARVALTDLKIDNFYYDENWPQLIKVIDWNFVDTETPHEGFVNDTIPKLGDVFYEVFTGLSLREQQQEDRIGKINVDLFAKTRQEQTWPMFWDQITFGTREIIRDMVFADFTGENQPLNLWTRWLARTRLLVDKDGLDKVFAVEAADLAGKLDLTPDWEVMESYSILRLINKSEQREARLREKTHRYIGGLVGERDFNRSELFLLSANRLYPGSIRLDFWLLFTQLGLTADSGAVFVDQIQDLPKTMEAYWKAGDFEALRNMLGRILDKFKNYWTVHTQETAKIIENLLVVLDSLYQIRYAEDLLFEDARNGNKKLPNFGALILKIISELERNKSLLDYLQDTSHLTPRYDLLVEQYRKMLQYINALNQNWSVDLELEFYPQIISFPWHNQSIAEEFKSIIRDVERGIYRSLFQERTEKTEIDFEVARQKLSKLTPGVLALLPMVDQFDDILEKISSSVNEYFPKRIDLLKMQIGKLRETIDINIEVPKQKIPSDLENIGDELENFKSNLEKLDATYKGINLAKDNLINDANIKLSIPSNLEKEIGDAEKQIKNLEGKLASLPGRFQTIHGNVEKIDKELNDLVEKQKIISSQSQNIEKELSVSGNLYEFWAPKADVMLKDFKRVSKQTEDILFRAKTIDEKKAEIKPYFLKIQEIEKSQQVLLGKLESVGEKFSAIDKEFVNFEKNLENVEQRIQSFADRIEKNQRRIILFSKRYKRLKRYLLAFKQRFWTRLFSRPKENKSKNIDTAHKRSNIRWLYLLPILGVLIFAGIKLQPVKPNIQNYILSLFAGTNTPTPVLTFTSTQDPSLTENALLNSPVAPTSEIVFSPVPIVKDTITPTPEKAMTITLEDSATLKVEPSDADFNSYAQKKRGAMTFDSNAQLAVAGKSKDNKWLLLYQKDGDGVWFGWADINWLNPLDEPQLKSLPVVISCSFTAADIPIFDGPNGERLDLSKRNTVYLVIDVRGVWKNIVGGFGGGWVQKEMCSSRIQ